MAARPVDYAALAEQARGGAPKVDYAAMAQQARGDTQSAQRPAGLPDGVSLPGLPGPPASIMSEAPGNIFSSAHPLSTLKANAVESGGQILDLGKGMLKGAANTGSTLLHTANAPIIPMPNGNTQVSPMVNNAANGLQRISQPHNNLQSVGRGIEQAGEFLLPGAAEEAGATRLLTMLPKAGKLAQAALRAIPAAMGSGIVNGAQGGSVAGGAAAGFGGSMVGSGLKALAPVIAETALGVRAGDRAQGRTPGQAILDETQGLRPGSIASQANSRVNELSAQVEKSLESAPDGSLAPARDVANSFVDSAVRRNTPESIKRTNALRDVITTKLGSDGKPVMLDKFGDTTLNTGVLDEAGQPITRVGRSVVGKEPAIYPEIVPARTLLDLKRGIGEQAQAFNPAVQNKLSDNARVGIYHALDSEMDRLAPQTQGANDSMTSLIPAAERAGAKDLNAGMVQRMIARGSAHTGALAGPLAAGAAGFEHGGIIGGVLGAGAGMLGQEVLTNPTVLMAAARAANAPATSKLLIPAFTGAAMQFGGSKR